jgi:antitoxin component of MazEF toxin-antitoxin module
MAIWIQKITEWGGQYRVTLPKDLVKIAGLDKARVVEVSQVKKGVIKIEEYHGKKENRG